MTLVYIDCKGAYTQTIVNVEVIMQYCRYIYIYNYKGKCTSDSTKYITLFFNTYQLKYCSKYENVYLRIRYQYFYSSYCSSSNFKKVPGIKVEC